MEFQNENVINNKKKFANWKNIANIYESFVNNHPSKLQTRINK